MATGKGDPGAEDRVTGEATGGAGLMRALYGDAAMQAILSDRAMIAAMLRVETALAGAQAETGDIPRDAADAIARAADDLRPDPAALADAAARAGIAAQPLIGALKRAAGDAGSWAHYGATSQDIVDSALAVQLNDALALLSGRLAGVEAALADKAAAYDAQPIPARTRHQIAAPTTLGAKIAVWCGIVARNRVRLAELRPRVLLLSLHCAAGNSAALGPNAGRVRALMAGRLGLGIPDGPWHAARDGMVELAGWLSLVTGGLGKMGLDLIQLGQSEVAEITAGTGGGSSTMPQKSNPVAAEALVTLARLNAADVGTMHQAMIHAQERDGTALGLEWAVLPAMLDRTAASLRIAQSLAETLSPAPERIAATFAADRGRMMAEAAGFVLARTMPRPQALRIVAEALDRVAADPAMTLPRALAELAPGRDWSHDLDPATVAGVSTHNPKD